MGGLARLMLRLAALESCAIAALKTEAAPRAAPRETLNFDFAWRHTLDAAAPAHPRGGSAPPPPQALPAYDDSSWALVDAPHDMGIEGAIAYTNPADQGFRQRTAGWYRKHFVLPNDWKGSSVWVYIEQSFHITNSYFNGVHLGEHPAGYTSFWLRLDDKAKWGAENVLALHVNATTGTGWWYEGGGLMRHQYLVKASPLHAAQNGVWAYANISSASRTDALAPSAGLRADSAVLHCQANLENDGAAAEGASILVDVLDAAGKQVATTRSAVVQVPAEGTRQLNVRTTVSNAELWSVPRPYLYTLMVRVLSASGAVLDTVNVTTGIRSVHFDADKGLLLNKEPVKVRGYCDHSNFGGVGGAVPDRVNLFRAQTLRATGGNAWRMARPNALLAPDLGRARARARAEVLLMVRLEPCSESFACTGAQPADPRAAGHHGPPGHAGHGRCGKSSINRCLTNLCRLTPALAPFAQRIGTTAGTLGRAG